MSRWMLARIGLILIGPCFAPLAAAQQVNLDTPLHSAGHGFYEQFGTSWGIRGNGWFFQFGGPPVAPPFGGFDPNAGANFGFAGPNGFFNITAGQGSTTTLGSASPSVTVMNGGTGYFSDTVQRPFVTGLVPVVGSPIVVPPVLPPYAPPQSVLAERVERLQTEGAPAAARSASGSRSATAAPDASGPSSADRGDLSVSEIKAQKAADKAAQGEAVQAEIADLLAKAQSKLAAGQPSVAKVYLQMAARRANGEQQAEIAKRIEQLGAADK